VLREVTNAYQAPDEPRRRFFFSHEQDLWVWFDEDDSPVAFQQLAYGKYRNEHAIRWKAGRGFTHQQVDDGENAGLVKQAPILIADGAFDAAGVLARFLQISAQIPQEIADFVAERLREHPEFREPTSPPPP
jgi:hypothetical protein